MDSALITLLANAGTAGIVIILILLGLLVPKRYHDRALRDARRLQAANDVLAEALAHAQGLNDRLATSGDLTNKLVSALIAVTGHPDPPAGQVPPAQAAPPALGKGP